MVAQLVGKLLELWNDCQRCRIYSDNCAKKQFDSREIYGEKLVEIYLG